MNIFLYDNTFEGFLTSVYDAFELNIKPEVISGTNQFQQQLFGNCHHINTDENKAKTIWNSLKKKTSNGSCNLIYQCFLSEKKGIELMLFEYILLAHEKGFNIEGDYTNDTILRLRNLQMKVVKDAQRLQMFVRFQKTKDSIFYASVEPDFNTLTLVTSHFKDRYADQRWVIYDNKRRYGLYYDLKKAHLITINNSSIHPLSGKIDDNVLSNDEKLFQLMWKKYYESVCIKERKNLKVHMQYLPRRFWKYLPEKANIA